MLERLQKIIAQAGIASRRKGEELIRAGRVSVNGRVVKELGFKADPACQSIKVDGRLLPTSTPKLYYLLYKPRGVITSLSDPQGRPTVKDLVPRIKTKVFPVGRLDYDAEGLLLLTNDGELAYRLTHPSYEVSRTYLVKIKGVLNDDDIATLRKGVRLQEGMSPAMKVTPMRRLMRNSWVKVTLHEGRNRVIKRTFAAINHPVLRLIRIQFGPLVLRDLKPGDYRPLTQREIALLREER